MRRTSKGKNSIVTSRKLSLSALIGRVEHPGAGGITTFIGVVRNNAHEKAVKYLEYEAYPELAERTMEQIGSEVLARWPEVRLAMAHRTGHLDIGEASVMIAASAPHRAEAFAACRYTIERIKAIMPVWKKEFASGEDYWVEGPARGRRLRIKRSGFARGGSSSLRAAGSDAAPVASGIGFFVTPHGFGHGGRAAAVIAALHELDSSLRFEIFTQIPEWFFRESLSGPFAYHSWLTDIGLVQQTALREDLAATLPRLDEFLPFDRARLDILAEEVKRTGCKLIVCDIAPLGVAVAHTAGIPSVLVENFTWDWIYEGYAREESRMSRHVAYLRSVFESADYHIQTEPVSVYHPADLLTPPVSRTARTPAREVRERLGVPADSQAVLITMGGISSQHGFSSQLKEQEGVYFVIPGGVSRRGPRTI